MNLMKSGKHIIGFNKPMNNELILMNKFWRSKYTGINLRFLIYHHNQPVQFYVKQTVNLRTSGSSGKKTETIKCSLINEKKIQSDGHNFWLWSMKGWQFPGDLSDRPSMRWSSKKTQYHYTFTLRCQKLKFWLFVNLHPWI